MTNYFAISLAATPADRRDGIGEKTAITQDFATGGRGVRKAYLAGQNSWVGGPRGGGINLESRNFDEQIINFPPLCS